MVVVDIKMNNYIIMNLITKASYFFTHKMLEKLCESASPLIIKNITEINIVFFKKYFNEY